MKKIPKIRVTLLGLLAFVSAVSIHYYVKANDSDKIIVRKSTTYYTPGQRDNCKWVVHISDNVTTRLGSISPIQIGIPEVIKDGYIAGSLQTGPGNSLLLAFKLPTQPEDSAPIVMTHVYDEKNLPLREARFRVFGSSLLSMVLYSTHEACIEAVMK